MMADLLGVWSARLLEVSWQAGLIAALVWGVCRLCPRMPAQVRAAIWWLVCVKFVIGLLWPQPLAWHVLPAATTPNAATRSVTLSGAIATDSIVTTAVGSSASAASSGVTWTDALLLTLAGVWFSGLLLQLALMARAWRRTRRLVRESTPASLDMAARAYALSELIGVGHVTVRISASIDTPRVTGALTPTILLPAAADRLSSADLDMTLCHELLHVRRGDLFLAWLPSAAQMLFFFHPLAWLAAHEHALAREAACDAAVLRTLNAEPDAYGALLLRLGITPGDIAPVAVGASSSFRTLKRRLIMLQHTSDIARSRATRWWLVAAIAALAVVPLRLAAQPQPQPQTPVQLQAQGNGRSYGYGSSKSEAQGPERRDGRKESRDDAWVLLRDRDNVTMSGRTEDVVEAQRQRGRSDGPILWFRRDGKAYVIRDAETIETVQALFRPIHELGERQGTLGGEQGKLGEQQGKLGVEQERLSREMAELSAKLISLKSQQMELAGKQFRNGDQEREESQKRAERLEAQVRQANERVEELSRRQEDLGRNQEELGREQESFGRRQEELGARQEEAGKRVERQLRELLERAISTGKAAPAR